ncbi:MAG: hypothetical protein U0Q19_14110 [Kineosporiaceae bacterium]
MSAITHRRPDLQPPRLRLSDPPAATMSAAPTRSVRDAVPAARPRPPFAVGLTLAGVAAVGTAVTFFDRSVLLGPAVMKGSVRGTALVMLAVAVPVLLGAMWSTHRGSERAVIWWLAATAYLLYNSVLLVFATPFNALYLAYEAMLGLSIAGVILLLRQLDVTAVAGRLNSAASRPIAAFLGFIALANLLAWLCLIVPALGEPSPEFLAGTGLITNPIHDQDLAFWIPAALIIAVWAWQRRPAGLVLATAYLGYWLLESIGVATDQWFGSTADPSSSIAGMGGAYLFAGLAVITVVPLVVAFRRPRR